ncbi:hypothetical protein FrEUN1fDRAFT_7505 [Parafrankia sp. EUN1f]|nr:hypothetical protein FrEUN1fDRAFT_7505 [Parafrankia sp. EUN1f]
MTIENRPFTSAVCVPGTAELNARQICRQIVCEELAPGASLPGEADLMARVRRGEGDEAHILFA